MKRFMLFACALAGAALLSFDQDAVGQEHSIEGIYAYDAAASADINAAIETAVAKMNFIVRPVARSRLKKTNPAYQRIAISRDAKEIVVTLDARKPIRMPSDGATIKWTREDGEKFDLHAIWKDTQLVQTYVAEDGQRVNDFSLGANPDTMTLEVTITSERLDKPMKYALAYKRIAAQ